MSKNNLNTKPINALSKPRLAVVISEKDRNKRLMLLLQELIINNKIDYIQLIQSMVMLDSKAMQKSYEIMTENINVE